MRKRKKGGKKQRNTKFSEGILSILRKEHNQTFNYKQIAARLGLNDPSSRNHIVKSLQKLKAKGIIQEIERGKYILTPSKNYHTGILDITSRGKGYVIVEGIEEDISIPKKHLNKGLHGDTVEVYVFNKRRRSGKAEGEITKIIQRKRTETLQILRCERRSERKS